MTLEQDLAIFNSWHLPFLNVLYTFSEKTKDWSLDIIIYWVIAAGCEIEKDLGLSPSPQKYSKNSWKLLPCLYLSTDLFKNAPCLMY